eukprot:4983835-Prymnesium_polylepis.1
MPPCPGTLSAVTWGFAGKTQMCPPTLGAALRRGGGGWGPLPSKKTKTLSLTGFPSFPLPPP